MFDRQHLDWNTSQAESGSHPAQKVPNHPLLVQLIVLQYFESWVDDRVSKDCAFGSLGKYSR